MASSPSSRDDARRALALVDLTDLAERSTVDDTRALCRRAVSRHGTVAAVCLWPQWVALAVDALADSGVRVATVTNFPSGDEALADVQRQTATALADGADEIDLVLRYRDVIAGRLDQAGDALAAIRDIVPTDGRHVLKVILETGSLGDPTPLATAARLAIDNGADFIKTSTGKTATSATLEATAIMLDTIKASGRHVGLKPSGGIRTLADAQAYLAQADERMGPEWVTPRTFRFGASGLLDALLEAIDDTKPATITRVDATETDY